MQKIKKGWKKVLLGEVCDINKKLISKGFDFNNIEYIDISSVGTGELLGINLLSLKEAPSRAKRLVDNGDIILSTVRPNRRSFYYIKKASNNTVVSTGFAVLTATTIEKKYLYYIINLQSFTDYLTNSAKGAAYPAVDTKIIYDAELIIPESIETQQKIASVLSKYDDLIENNNKRIKVLEETAKAIYEEWFVNYNFPGSENVEMVDSGNDDFGMIPEGWEVEKVGDELKTIKRKKKLKKTEYLKKGEFQIIDQGRDFIAGYTNNSEVIEEEYLPMVIFGDHTRVVKYIDFPFACGADGTQLLYPKNEKLLPVYFYMAIKNIDLGNFHYARHFKFLKEEFIIIPTNGILLEFNEKLRTSFKLSEELRKQNQNLKETRDLLIPRLINGEVDVETLDVK